MKVLRILGMILLAALPARAQTVQTVCNPGTSPGQLVCQQQPIGTGKRVAIVAAVAVAATVVTLAIRYHKRHRGHSPTHTRGAERR